MFNPYYRLSEYSAIDDYMLQINPDSSVYNEYYLDYIKFIGRVCRMAICHKNIVDAFFIYSDILSLCQRLVVHQVSQYILHCTFYLDHIPPYSQSQGRQATFVS
ncbi:PREDICTED: E3 ubiquitin-protein ligase NEDD4-like [Amphimedon queenslandica]|uniref:HECT-type E3 ubiquitin transferase n=1 Tax=Amphimedon queenslandica TaxID=400682 RepID=A0AAN0J4S3_AMPQE|nr:PREDICTED: E3 ubiquitin-protein ligase NEDD4-like [Amphimedon queenslandica]|eukprot:XP_019851747.1 PREDICTED: E3 ubiquitin-protein ligase NEDD4-like [Amphimedon queenslandica]